MQHKLFWVSWALAAAVIPCANAGTISSVSAFVTPGASTGSAGPIGNTPAPNNDDAVGDSPNVIPYSIFFNSPGFLETEFVLAQSGGTTEYRFTQNFINNSSATWTGFRFELGFGTGANFVLSQLADNLEFDRFENHTTATSNRWAVTVDQAKTLEFGGTPLARISTISFSFAIDVPDDLAAANPAGVNRFTLRQTPLAASAVPEPGTWLLAVPVLLLIAYARRRAASAAIS